MIVGIFSKYFIFSQRSKHMILIFEVLLLILTLVKAYRNRRIKESVIRYLLYSYVFLIVVSTVLNRIYWGIWKIDPDMSCINLVPFYSYGIILDGNKVYLRQVIMNCCMLFPVGFLLPCAYKNLKLFSCVRICFYLSMGIEFLQLIYGCGLCELDDIMHNVFGGFCGASCFLLLRVISEQYRNKRRMRKGML